jgi:hypothetical protein
MAVPRFKKRIVGTVVNDIGNGQMNTFLGVGDEVNTGIIDMKGVVKLAVKHNIPWLVVEQENFQIPVFESAEINYRNTRALLDACTPTSQ